MKKKADLTENMDLEYRILNLYKIRQFSECLKLCAENMEEQSDRLIEFIRIRALTIQAKIAGNEYQEVEYYTKDDLASTAVAKTPRPGTSFQSFQTDVKTANRVPLIAMSRAGTAAPCATARSRTARSARTASRTSRAVTALSIGISSNPAVPISLRFLSKDDTLFVPASKTLFEYVFYCEGDVRKGLDIAFQTQKADVNDDWWWNFSIARCYSVLGLYRNAENYLRQALKQHKHIAIYLRLMAMFVTINQPFSALEVCKQALAVFHDYTPLLLEKARIYDQMGNQALAVKEYRTVALEDPSNMEAVANIAMNNFYNDQPEIALRYYRRLLATNPPGSEIYNNLGLCCLYCNQWDLTLPCFRQALFYSTRSESRSDIWFNLCHVALSTGDMSLARRCLQVSLALNYDNEAAMRALSALDNRRRSQNGQNQPN